MSKRPALIFCFCLFQSRVPTKYTYLCIHEIQLWYILDYSHIDKNHEYQYSFDHIRHYLLHIHLSLEKGNYQVSLPADVLRGSSRVPDGYYY